MAPGQTISLYQLLPQIILAHPGEEGLYVFALEHDFAGFDAVLMAGIER